MSFAETTSVPVERTRGEIEKVCRQHGANAFASGWHGAQATIEFIAHGRRVRFCLSLPSADEKRFTRLNNGLPRTASQATKLWEQAIRTQWRKLLLVIKAKLESAESGIETFEDAFMAHIVMPSGKTISEDMTPLIAKAYKENTGLLLEAPK